MSVHEKTERNHKCEIVNGTILESNSLHNTAILKYVLIKMVIAYRNERGVCK